YSILDEAVVCHAGFSIDGKPFVIPMTYGRRDDQLFLHGSVASRLLRSLAGGVDVCVTVTLLDGLVLARSAFHHSMNYRSVVVFGTAREIADGEEKFLALETITEHIAPGRWSASRQPNPAELKATTVLALPLKEASAKIRTGPPKDDEEDYELPVWAGVAPLRLTPSHAIADDRLHPDAPELPASLAGFTRERE
ncbi:MAG TPA: pyridoxamine 5'-phosphate oxidase family protein, partial [Thermoanaerobaculia bacterium]|nr:pyridoxamine 5'-phosphate oxidase family protein [Thermoanaerobaculia bacterium]